MCPCHLRHAPSNLSFFGTFIMKAWWTLPNAFSASLRWSSDFFFIYIMLIDLCLLNNLTSWDESNLNLACSLFLLFLLPPPPPESQYVTLTSLDLAKLIKLFLNSLSSTCPSLQDAGNKGVHHHVQPSTVSFKCVLEFALQVFSGEFLHIYIYQIS